MRRTSAQNCGNRVTVESRDTRFAELDAQIEAEAESHHQRTPSKSKRRRRSGPRLPAAVRKEITLCVRQLRKHRTFFVEDEKLKDRAARFLHSLLPPKRKRGRPGLASVTKASMLRRKLRKVYPDDKPEQIWKKIYPEAIPGYAAMHQERQKAERILLRERVRSRTTQQKQSPCPVVSN
jgi:hypothetical protein